MVEIHDIHTTCNIYYVEIVQIPGSTTADHSLSVKQFFFSLRVYK